MHRSLVLAVLAATVIASDLSTLDSADDTLAASVSRGRGRGRGTTSGAFTMTFSNRAGNDEEEELEAMRDIGDSDSLSGDELFNVEKLSKMRFELSKDVLYTSNATGDFCIRTASWWKKAEDPCLDQIDLEGEREVGFKTVHSAGWFDPETSGQKNTSPAPQVVPDDLEISKMLDREKEPLKSAIKGSVFLGWYVEPILTVKKLENAVFNFTRTAGSNSKKSVGCTFVTSAKINAKKLSLCFSLRYYTQHRGTQTGVSPGASCFVKKSFQVLQVKSKKLCPDATGKLVRKESKSLPEWTDVSELTPRQAWMRMNLDTIAGQFT